MSDDSSSTTSNVIAGAVAVAFAGTLLAPTVPAFILENLWTLYGYGGFPFRSSMFDYVFPPRIFPPLWVFGSYLPIAAVATLVLWYGARFDRPNASVIETSVLVVFAAIYLLLTVAMAIIGEPLSAGYRGDLWVLLGLFIIFIGYPILATLPTFTFALFIAAVIRGRPAYLHLRARYKAEVEMRQLGGKVRSNAEIWARVLTRLGPPKSVLEDTNRFEVEARISDLMIEVEQLRTEIAALTAAKRGQR